MPQEQQTDKASATKTLDSFLSLNDEQRKMVLGKMSFGQKTYLRDTLKLRSGSKESAPAVRPPELKMEESKLGHLGAAVSAGRHEAGKAAMGLTELPGRIIQHPIDAISGVGKELVLGPARELAGMPQPGQSKLSAPTKYFGSPGDPGRFAGALDTFLGGNPGAARMAKQSGEPLEAIADLWTVPLITVGFGKALNSLPGIGDIAEEVKPQRREIAAMKKLMGHEYIASSPTEQVERMVGVQQLMKQAASEIGITDETMGKAMPNRSIGESQDDYVGRLVRGNATALEIAKRTVDIADRPLRKVMETYAGRDVTGTSNAIAADLDRQAAATVDTGVKSALSGLAEKVRGAHTVGELDAIKAHANKEIEGLFSGVPGQNINASAQSAYAYKLAADSIRTNLYPQLQKFAGYDIPSGNMGIDLAKLGRRESDAIALRDGMHSVYYNFVAPEQASKEALGFLQYVFGEGHDHSLYSRHIARRLFEGAGIVPGPAGMYDVFTKKAIGKLGKGGLGENVVSEDAAATHEILSARRPGRPLPGGGTGGRNLKQLPGGPDVKQLPGAPFQFEIPTGLPQEVISPYQTGTAKRYEGTREAANPNFEPMDSTTFRDRESPPDPANYRYSPDAAAQRRQAIGSTGEVTPDISFTGAPTTTETVWQHIPEVSGGDLERGGGGVMRTADHDLARNTLKRLEEYAKSHPEKAAELDGAIRNLKGQMREFYNAKIKAAKDLEEQRRIPPSRRKAAPAPAPAKTVRVLPGKPGQTVKSTAKKRYGGVFGATDVGQAEQRDRDSETQAPVDLPQL